MVTKEGEYPKNTMSAYQRRKGLNGEREVVNFWKPLFPEAHRHLEFQKEEAEDGVDVILDKWHNIQSKIGSQVPKKIYDFLEQMKPRTGAINFVQCKRDNKPWVVILSAEDFKEILSTMKANNLLK